MKQVHLLIGIFLFFLIYFIGGANNQFYQAIALGSLVVYWWISEPIPLYVTALVPIIVGPILGLVSIAELESSYGNKMVFLFLGGFLIALAIEKWDLHKKIAFMIIQRTGSSGGSFTWFYSFYCVFEYVVKQYWNNYYDVAHGYDGPQITSIRQ